MTLKEQWQQDVKQFGEIGAESIWEFDVVKRFSGFSGDYEEYVPVKRKQSAALPFDLAAALAGDAVEILTCNEWLDCSNDYALYLYDNEGHDNKNSKTHLRMKHPRRVGVDYSRFED